MSDTLTVDQGIRLVTEIEAERILLARGFTKARCEECAGIGFHESKPDDTLFQGQAKAQYGHMCDRCGGHRWNWKRPTK